MDHITAQLLRQPPVPRRHSWAVPLLAVAGLLGTGLAAAVGNGGRTPVEAALGGPQVVVTSGAYEAGHASGWHVHPGLHSVVVLTGELTVFDEQCGRQAFGPGEAYLGGDRPHLVRNDTRDEATYVVTYARLPSAALDPGTTVAVPTACELR
jgi:quercetin dioxygenase-like cupin family protein